MGILVEGESGTAGEVCAGGVNGMCYAFLKNIGFFDMAYLLV